jgi:Ca-activated chloride channel homolog
MLGTRTRWPWLFLFLGLATIGLAQATGPQPASPQKIHDPNFKVDVDLVLVNATVTDPFGRRLSGLEKNNFSIFEDGTEQEILSFSSEDVPVSIGLVLDLSGSMQSVVDSVRRAAHQFLYNSNPQDEILAVGFHGRAQLLSPFTHDPRELESQVLWLSSHGMTALFDGIYLGLSSMRDAHNKRRAIVVITDGGENHSRYSQKDIQQFVRESDVQIYFIAMPGTDYLGPGMFREMAELTGGRTFDSRTEAISDLVQKIGIELRHQYVLSYRPGNRARDGRWRKIKLVLRPPKGLPPLQTYYRTGYTAPAR